MLEDIRNIKSTKKEHREFGLTIGIILVILGLVALWRGKGLCPYFFVSGAFFIFFALALPGFLKPFQKTWMTFSVVIGFFVSRLILSVLFFAVLTPIGIISRIFGKDILDERIDKTRESYWKEREAEPKDRKSYENQY
ncbi:MAG: hypothetical protein ISS90_02390 [Candidatus Omnitrophica bacterium]|nr:hypothetical protein [Candidatus Omnitrophota bacterium]